MMGYFRVKQHVVVGAYETQSVVRKRKIAAFHTHQRQAVVLRTNLIIRIHALGNNYFRPKLVDFTFLSFFFFFFFFFGGGGGGGGGQSESVLCICFHPSSIRTTMFEATPEHWLQKMQ